MTPAKVAFYFQLVSMEAGLTPDQLLQEVSPNSAMNKTQGNVTWLHKSCDKLQGVRAMMRWEEKLWDQVF